ncbi:hypothetical protein Cni_G23016 [Canna indica]|uniref:Uncharacterized protein n=1 Tax=Canna indica TaxID=4628 RepID=A0AAQ3QM26_9LILI|nr:hypothetical protein Cni_G23016 [Canna indica]
MSSLIPISSREDYVAVTNPLFISNDVDDISVGNKGCEEIRDEESKKGKHVISRKKRVGNKKDEKPKNGLRNSFDLLKDGEKENMELDALNKVGNEKVDSAIMKEAGKKTILEGRGNELRTNHVGRKDNKKEVLTELWKEKEYSFKASHMEPVQLQVKIEKEMEKMHKKLTDTMAIEVNKIKDRCLIQEGLDTEMIEASQGRG